VRDAVLTYRHLGQLRAAGVELLARRAEDGREFRLRLPDEQSSQLQEAEAGAARAKGGRASGRAG
jgi:hypothetical protein